MKGVAHMSYNGMLTLADLTRWAYIVDTNPKTVTISVRYGEVMVGYVPNNGAEETIWVRQNVILDTITKPLSRKLTADEIEALATFHVSTRRRAVENFLSSMLTDLTFDEQIGNLNIDARSYSWNITTIDAIRRGIYLAFGIEYPGM